MSESSVFCSHLRDLRIEMKRQHADLLRESALREEHRWLMEKRWERHEEARRRLNEEERSRAEHKDLLWRTEILIAKLSGTVLTKNVSVPATGWRPIEMKGLDAAKGVFTAYASTWHKEPDAQGDVVEKGSFAASIRERPQVPLLWAHQHSETIGKCTGLSEDHYGLRFMGEVCRDTRRGREALALMEHGSLGSFSIGYGVDDYDHRRDGVRVLKRISLLEVSIVPVPADRTARLIP